MYVKKLCEIIIQFYAKSTNGIFIFTVSTVYKIV